MSMSTGRHLPQNIGHHLLADGHDEFGRFVHGNVVIVEAVEITDPEHIPTGAEPGLWGEAVLVEDPGGEVIRRVGDDEFDDDRLYLDPPHVDEDFEPDPSDLFHLDVQYTEPLPVAA